MRVCLCVCACVGLRGKNGTENEIMGERKVEKTDFPVLLDSMRFLDAASPLLRQTAHDYMIMCCNV